MFPFDLTGPQFIPLYIGTLIAAGVGTSVYRNRAANTGSGCAEHPLHIELDPYEIAYLRGGRAAVAEAAISSLVHSKVFEPEGDNKFKVNRTAPVENHPVPKTFLDRLIADEYDAKEVREKTGYWKQDAVGEQMKRRLEKHGFVVTDEVATKIQGVSCAIMLSPCLIGVPKMIIGASIGKPITFLVLLVFLTVIIAMCVAFKKPERTARGDAALEDLKNKNEALKATAYRNAEGLNNMQVATAAALFGTSIFAFGTIHDFQKRIAPPSSGGSGCGSSCGSGGGCGGGGCGGGCGGCGG